MEPAIPHLGSFVPHLERSLGSVLLGPASHLLKYNSPFKDGRQGFFLQLDPFRWRVRFDGLQVSEDKSAGKFFESWLAEQSRLIGRRLEQLRGGELHDFLYGKAMKFIEAAAVSINRPVGDDAAVEFALAGATSVLNKGMELGCDEGPHWRLRDRNSNGVRLHFQDSLDLPAIFDFDEDALRKARGLPERWAVVGANGESRTGRLKGIYNPSPNILDKQGLVGEDNYHTFLAEYIVALGGGKLHGPVTDLQSGPGVGLQYGFLPLRGLMQWRAAVDWISTSDLIPKASEKELQLARTFVESNYSSALIEAFVNGLLSILQTAQTRQLTPEEFQSPFALLWWAHDILFLKGGALMHALTRDASGALRPFDGLPPEDFFSRRTDEEFQIADGFCAVTRLNCATQGDADSYSHRVRLRLSAGASGESVTQLTETCGFDEVVYRVFLLRLESDEDREIFQHFITVLRSRLHAVARESEYEKALKRLAFAEKSKAGAYRLGHSLWHWAAGPRRDLEGVQQFIRDGEDREVGLTRLRAGIRGFTRIWGVGQILDVSARATNLIASQTEAPETETVDADAPPAAKNEPTPARAFLVKDEWHTAVEYRVWDSLDKLAAEVQTGQSKEGRPKRLMLNEPSDALMRARLAGWIPDPDTDRLVRPSDVFYEHIFFEVLCNVAQHGEPEPCSSTVNVGVSVEGSPEAYRLVLSNDTSEENAKKLGSAINGFKFGEWFSWGDCCNSAVGGLSYIESMLHDTQSGRIFVCVNPGQVLFGLEINGLTLTKETHHASTKRDPRPRH